MLLKFCKRCKTQKSLDLFSKKKTAKDGMCPNCKECEKLIHKEYYEKNRESILEKDKQKRKLGSRAASKPTLKTRLNQNIKRKELRRNSPELSLYTEAKKRAKEKDLEFSILLDDIFVPPVCPILLIPLKVGTGKLHNNSPSLDRVDNSKGYTKDNIMVISYLANRMKSSASKEQLLQFSIYMLEFFKGYYE